MPEAAERAIRPETSGERDWSDFAAATIVARNYLSMARVVCATFLEHHPGARAFVLLADEVDGAFDPAQEPFEVVEARDIGIPDFRDFSFKYDVLEFSTAVKPYFLQYLFERYGVRNLIYLDPDIQVFGPFHELAELLERNDVVLTPHILEPLREDGRRPNDLDLLVSGVFNLGFVALRRGAEASKLLDWWQSRLYDQCFSAPERGLFTDQKWMTMVPCLFESVGVLRHPGYNAAYWNLQERLDLERLPEGYRIQGVPLRFFHFSGYDRRNPNRISKYQDRFRLPDLNRAYRGLYTEYGLRLVENGLGESSRWKYCYGTFDNGASLPRIVRRAYWEMGEARRRFGDPFRAAGDSFYAWLVAPHRDGSPIPNVGRIVLKYRVDLQEAFPDSDGAHAPAFLDWLITHVETDFQLNGPYVEEFRRQRERFAPVVPPPPQPAGEEQASPAIVEGSSTPPFGVNLFGYLDTESGIGEVARSLAAMVRSAGIPHAFVNVEQPWLRRNDRTILSFSSEWPYSVNLLCVNADQAPHVCERYGLTRRPGTYQIGYWFWELSRFPAKYVASATPLFDEVWVASDFCLDAISRAARLPVVRMRPAFEPRPPGRKSRGDFGFDDEFVFLYVFDAASILKRKNPAGTIAAFRDAFDGDARVRLVLKTTNAKPRQIEALDRLAGSSRVQVWNEYLDRGELLDLIAAADAYVSLHRSEGLGLTPLEALMFGKPVVATDYSGVRDFLDAPGAFTVRCREVELTRDHGPYAKGSVWAEPDHAHAVARLREVHERTRAGCAPLDISEIRRRYSVGTTASALAERLRLIRAATEGRPVN